MRELLWKILYTIEIPFRIVLYLPLAIFEGLDMFWWNIREEIKDIWRS